MDRRVCIRTNTHLDTLNAYDYTWTVGAQSTPMKSMALVLLGVNKAVVDPFELVRPSGEVNKAGQRLAVRSCRRIRELSMVLVQYMARGDSGE